MRFNEFWAEFDAAEERLRKRAEDYVSQRCKSLPKLNKKQTAALVGMLIAAYNAGQHDADHQQTVNWMDSKFELSQRGIAARRKKAQANRAKVVAAFNAAARAGRDTSVEAIAAACGVSRATAYRALKAGKAK